MTAKNPHDWLNEHGDYLYRFALARLRDSHLAEDAVQETLLAAIRSADFAGKSAPRTWLTGILKHKIVDIIRKQITEAPVDDMSLYAADEDATDEFFNQRGHWADTPLTWPAAENALQQQQFLAVLQRCLDRLPPKLARLFLLREVHEEDNESICKELQISPTNAWVMLYRARMSLRQCLELHWLAK